MFWRGKSCKDLISEWNNPFKQRKALTCWSSALIPTEKANEDILNAYKLGKLGFERFLEERICSHNISLYDPIKQNKLKSFNMTEKGKKEATKGTPLYNLMR